MVDNNTREKIKQYDYIECTSEQELTLKSSSRTYVLDLVRAIKSSFKLLAQAPASVCTCHALALNTWSYPLVANILFVVTHFCPIISYRVFSSCILLYRSQSAWLLFPLLVANATILVVEYWLSKPLTHVSERKFLNSIVLLSPIFCLGHYL